MKKMSNIFSLVDSYEPFDFSVERDSVNNVVFQSSYVFRHHCDVRINFVKCLIEINDYSTNGTFVSFDGEHTKLQIKEIVKVLTRRGMDLIP